MKILCMVGTRPEAIKMAPVYYALKARPREFDTLLVATAQHRHMLDQILAVMEIVPDIDLDLMRPGQDLAGLTGKVINEVAAIIRETRPDAVLVQGDTTTVLGAGLAAFYEKVPIGHVEAGLRTYNFAAPWPEEMNRRLVDAFSEWCFAPTETARQNLLGERIPPQKIFVTGNTAIDALRMVMEKVRNRPLEVPGLDPETLAGRRLILVTGHRRESFGERFQDLCLGLRDLADRFADLILVYPVHLNPQVQQPVRDILGHHPRILLLDPVDYFTCVRLMMECCIIITDSGGIQEEAPTLGKPVLVTRETTERPEGVACGNALLVGTSRERILSEASRLLEDPVHYAAMSHTRNPYGDGQAASRIVEALLSWD
jgi:UDP-N-acetylglucosamine 2-epimerase